MIVAFCCRRRAGNETHKKGRLDCRPVSEGSLLHAERFQKIVVVAVVRQGVSGALVFRRAVSLRDQLVGIGRSVRLKIVLMNSVR